MGAALLQAACAGGGDSASDGPVALDCERHGYPCGSAEVRPEVAREGIRIGDAALDRFAEDGPAAALAWVREQPGVVHAIGDDVALRFRLEGGRPVWVLTARALAHAGGGHGRGTAANPDPRTVPEPIAASLLPAPPLGAAAAVWAALLEVAGRDRNGDRKVDDRDFRRALVLDPFHWEWSRLESYQYREGIEVTRMLEVTRGYEGGVVRYLRDHDAGEAAFTTWSEYDLVHFAGHGHRICEKHDECFSVLFTGDTVTSQGLFDDSTLGLGRETGIFEALDASTGAVVMKKRHVAVGADWFAAHYQGKKLDRTLIFLNGCGTMNPGDPTVPDFLRPLLGSGGSTVVGWTEVVPGQPAQTAGLYVYRQMTEHGLRAGDVLRELERDGRASVENTQRVTTRMRAASRSGSRPRDARIRIREVVGIHAPDGGPLADGVPPPGVFGGSPDDGRVDTLHVDLHVDGVQPEERGRWSISLELNGRALRRGIGLSERDKVGDYAYRVPIRGLSVRKDLETGRPDTLEAVVSLPEGGESRSAVVLELRPCYWKARMSGTYDRELSGYAVTFGPILGTDGWNAVQLGQLPGTAAGQALGAPPLEGSDGLFFFIPGPLDARSFGMGRRHGDGQARISTPEVPVGVSSRGRLVITAYRPDEMVVGGFAMAYDGVIFADPGSADQTIQGEFVWTPSCPTAGDLFLGRAPEAYDRVMEIMGEGRIP